MAVHKIPNLDEFEWQKAVLAILSTPPVSPTKGDRYIVGVGATGVWSGKDNQIATYITAWEYSLPLAGMFVYVDQLYYFNGSEWSIFIELIGVPYTGAVTDVDLGVHKITASNGSIKVSGSTGEGEDLTLNPAYIELLNIDDVSGLRGLNAYQPSTGMFYSGIFNSSLEPQYDKAVGMIGNFAVLYANSQIQMTEVVINEGLVNEQFFPMVGGLVYSEGGLSAGLLFQNSITLYDQADSGATNILFTNNDLSVINILGVSSETGRLTFASLGTGGDPSTRGFDIIGDFNMSKISDAGTGVVESIVIKNSPLFDYANSGDGVRQTFKSSKIGEGTIFTGDDVDVAYIDAILENNSKTEWLCSIKMWIGNYVAPINWLEVQSDGLAIIKEQLKVVTNTNTNIETNNIHVDLGALLEGLSIDVPVLIGQGYSTEPEAFPMGKITGFYNSLFLADFEDADYCQMIFAKIDFSNIGIISCNFTDSRFEISYDLCPSDDNTYDLGKSGQAWNNIYGSGTLESAKNKLTIEGGFATKMTNKTGSASVKGTIVRADTANDNAFTIAPISSDMPIAVVYEAGIADGSECWVVVSGIAEVLLKDGTASGHGNWVETADVAGRANATGANPNTVTHMQEIGHCVESKTSGTDVLAKVVLHFN